MQKQEQIWKFIQDKSNLVILGEELITLLFQEMEKTSADLNVKINALFKIALTNILTKNKTLLSELILANVNFNNIPITVIRKIKSVFQHLEIVDCFTDVSSLLEIPEINDLINKLVYGNTIIDISNYSDLNDNLTLSLINLYCHKHNLKLIMEPTNNSEDLEVQSALNMFLEESYGIPLLTEAEEKKLFARYKSGDQTAKEELITKNVRLVIYVAKMMQKTDYELEDIIQDGFFGLTRAVEKYNPDLGYKFSTYAVRWIKSFMQIAIRNNSYATYLSDYHKINLKRYRNSLVKLESLFGRTPTNKEIAADINLPIEEINEYEKMNMAPTSLNKLVGDEVETEFGELIHSNSETVEETVVKKITNSEMINVIESLNLPRVDKLIAYLRYGFFDQNPLSDSEIARILGLSRQRIQILVERLNNTIKEHPYFIDGQTTNVENINQSPYLNIYEVFPGVKVEKIQKAIETLEETEKNKIYLAFGMNLNEKIPFTVQEYNRDLGPFFRKIRVSIHSFNNKNR